MHHSSVSTEWILISVSFAVGVQLLLDQHCGDKSKYHIHDMSPKCVGDIISEGYQYVSIAMAR